MNDLSPRAHVLPPSATEATSGVTAEAGAKADAAAIVARARARRLGDWTYAGAVTPPEAWQLFLDGAAKLVDVRTAAELRYVGRVPGAAHAEWHGSEYAQAQRFVATLQTLAAPEDIVLLLCRSAVRSHHAAAVAAAVGYTRVFNILEGFEGQRNHEQQRGLIDGWRHHRLPWLQE